MKKIYTYLMMLTVSALIISCNEEWSGEQYEHYISFKAPINSDGVSRINVRYKANEATTYQVPMIVSGTTLNDKNYTVRIGLDPDTLVVLNKERYSTRIDLYYQVLPATFYSLPETVEIKAGENTALLPIDFKLNNIDLSEKWVLPLTVEESSDGSYTPNYRKHYRKALLRVMPFNDYSGNYSAVNYKCYIKGAESEAPFVKNYVMTYVVDDQSLFFYAGIIDETRVDRKGYRILAKFINNDNGEIGNVELSPADSDNKMKFQIGKDDYGKEVTPTYSVTETMDPIRPYLKRKTIIIRNINYTYVDYTTIPGVETEYHVIGSLALERQINTQIPDEDQAIDWEAGN